MKKLAIVFISVLSFNSAVSQVFNFGADEVTFKNLIQNGITYVKTGDAFFDSTLISHLEAHWTLTDFKIVEQYKRPEKTSTALFVTTKERTKKHMMDRKNQHVLVLQAAEVYVPRKKVEMDKTLGYMYLNGFYDLVEEKDEHRYTHMLIKALNKGFNFIQNKKLVGEPVELNAKVAELVIGDKGPSVGNILILNREQTRHAIVTDYLEKLNIRYRLLSEEEYYAALDKKDPKHVILYFAANRFTEMGLVRLSDGELLYSKHFREEGYATLSKKELKLIAPYFM